MDVYIRACAPDEHSMRAALAALDQFLSLSVRRVSAPRPAGDDWSFAVVRATTLNSPDTVLALLDEALEAAAETAQRADFELLLAGRHAWDSEVLALPSPRLDAEPELLAAVLEVGPDVRLPDGTRLDETVPSSMTEGARLARETAAAWVPDEPVGVDALARVPDWEAAFLWEHEGLEWVPVDMAWGWQKDAEITLCLLLDAGIPATFSTRPFAEMYGWFMGSHQMVGILVPPSRVAEATALLEAAFDDPEGVFGDSAEQELQALYEDRPFFQFCYWALRAYVLVYGLNIATGLMAPVLY